MQDKYHDYNFTSCPFAPPARQMFSNYGPSLVDVGENKELDFLRQEPKREFQSVYPVMPLSETPNDVPYPWTDRVMGEIIEKNKLLSAFIPRVNLMIGQRKRSSKPEELREILAAVERYKSDPNNTDIGVQNMLKPWFTELLQQYEAVADIKEPQVHNSAYAGGCLVSFPEEDKKGLLVSASGIKFDTLNLNVIYEDSSGIAKSKIIAAESVPGSVYEIKGQNVHSQKLLSVRLEKSCLIYSVNANNSDSPLTFLRQTELNTGTPTSVNLSPYIPEECLIATDEGQCFLWTETCCEEVIKTHPSRFETEDKWRHAEFGSHPRQIVFSDPTMVQTFDLREPCVEGNDLFALPNKHLHQKERIRMCQTFQRNPFYQIIATDYSLLLVDERFPGHVVLKWDHMLYTPPQYISVLDLKSNGGDSTVYIGSQVPSEVHGFQFRIRGDKPPQTVSVPLRVDRMRDMLKNPLIMESVSHVKVLEERFHTSLTGLHALPWGFGHMVIQVDSHGDVFGQMFQEKQSGADGAVETESPALNVTKQWVDCLESQFKQYLGSSGRKVEKDVTLMFDDIQYMRPVCTSCRLCIPSSSETCGQSLVPEGTVCLCCMHMVETGKQLFESAEKDTILPSSRSCDLPSSCGLAAVEKLPCSSAMSRLLLKQWNKEKDIENELKDWDTEVLKYRKHRRKKKQEKINNGKEADLDRFRGRTMRTRSSACLLSEQQMMDAESSEEEDYSHAGDKEAETNEPEGYGAMAPENEEPAGSFQELVSGSLQGPLFESHSYSGKSQSDKDREITETVCSVRNSENVQSSSKGISVDRSPLEGMSDSDISLFSDTGISSARKSKRRLSACSLSSVRSTLSQASVISFPGFRSSPKHTKHCRNSDLSLSQDNHISVHLLNTQRNCSSNQGDNSETLEKGNATKSIERDESGIQAFYGAELSDQITPSQSMFSSPLVANKTFSRLLSNSEIQGLSPKLKLSVSPSKVRKKTYQPGF